MELLSRLIIGKKSKNPEKRDIIWNMAGSFLYAFASMVLSIAVVQIAGEDAGGIFTFAFTTFGQHMFMMAYFGIRPFQITDTGGKYSFGDYLGLRLLTCGAAVLTGMGYVFLNGYSFEKAAVVFLMVVYKVIDAVGVFLASLAYTKDLAAASLWAVGAQAAGFLVFDVLVIRELPNVEWRSAKGKKQELFAETILLFCSAVLDFYIFSASKYAIEGCMADRDMAVFGAIFMPTSIITLVAGFVIRPYLTKMSFTWEMGRTRRFLKIQKRIALIIAALTVLAVGGAWILGIPVLSLLYPNLRTGLSQCRPALVLIIFGGALNAYMNLFYYSLVIMKKQKYIFGVYGLVSLMAVLVSTPFVRWGGIFGGALAYVVLTGALMVLFGLIDLAGILEHKRKNPEQRNLE